MTKKESNNEMRLFVLDMVYFWIIIGVSILEPINELRNGPLRNKINAILERLRQIRQLLPAQQQSLPQ